MKSLKKLFLFDKPKIDAKNTAFASGNTAERNLTNWLPTTVSADKAIIGNKPVIEGRLTDLSRNVGFISASIQTSKNAIVGSKFRLQLMPSYRALGIDVVEANKWAGQVEALFNSIADAPECLFDARRQKTFTQIIREAIGMDLLYGESFFTREWRPNKSGFSTCFQSIAPPRVDTPMDLKGLSDVKNKDGYVVRGGVAIDEYGEAVGYYISKKHPNDFGYDYSMNEYSYVKKFNEFGWLNVIHIIDTIEPSQTRGISSLAAVINPSKMQFELSKATVELAIASSKYAMTIKSDHESDVLNALNNCTEDALGEFENYRAAKNEHAKKINLFDDGIAVTRLFGGESLDIQSPKLPPTNYAEFQREQHLNNAKAAGLSYEQYTGDFSSSNFASSRMSTQIASQNQLSKSKVVAEKLASLILRAFIDEAIVKGIINPPKGVDYWASRTQLLNSNWIGSGRLVVDELKAAKASEIRMNNGLTTQQQECSDNGLDWQEVNDQRQYEELDRIARGLPPRIAESAFLDTKQELEGSNEQ
jgi:lambda family phage portal protein